MGKYKIIQDRKKCLGCMACLSFDQKFLEESGDKPKLRKEKDKGKDIYEAELKDSELAAAKEVAEACPVNAIQIADEKGKKVA